MRSAGSTLPEFLRNLDQLHTRVQLSFPYLSPPSFAVQAEHADGLELQYYSSRPGLASLVVGLLRGLGERFDLELEIKTERVETERAHDVFQIRWRSKASRGSVGGSSSA